MNNIKEVAKNFFKQKGLSFYFLIGTFVFSLISLILYINTGVTIFTQELSVLVITLLSVSMILNMVLLYKEQQILIFALYILGFLAWLEFFVNQVTYITNVLIGIDEYRISMSFIMSVLFLSLNWITSLTAGIVFSINNGKKEKVN